MKKIELSRKEEQETVEKVWSAKRVLIAFIIALTISGLVLWSMVFAAEQIIRSGKQVLGVQNEQIPDNVRLPNEDDVTFVLEVATKYVDDILSGSAKPPISPLPQINEWIDGIVQLPTRTEVGVEDIVCWFFCK